MFILTESDNIKRRNQGAEGVRRSVQGRGPEQAGGSVQVTVCDQF